MSPIRLRMEVLLDEGNTMRAAVRFAKILRGADGFRLHSRLTAGVIPCRSMTRWLLLIGLGVASDAAVIRGTVVEHQTGRPLARATVMAQAIAGTPGATQSVRTDSYGSFEFPQLVGG